MTTVHELSPRTPVLSLQDVVIAYQEAHQPAQRVVPVSYTHLTLPTKA